MAHTVISAKTGAISSGSAETTVRDITIEYSESSAPWAASNTQGGMSRAVGNADWKATFTLYAALGAVMPGATFTLTAYTGTDNYSGPAIVDELSVEADIKGGGLVRATVTASGNGVLARSAGTVTDASTPAPKNTKGLKVNFNAADRTDATGWQLVLKSENKEYHSAATYDVTTDLNWAHRVAGRKDASGSWTEFEGSAAQLPAVGASGGTNILKLYVDATAFYEIKWPIVETVSHPIQVESGDIEEVTINWSFNGVDNANGAIGYIKKPDTTAWWP